MNFFPSPPSSPLLNSNSNPTDNKVICGSCDKPLSSDWFCSDCHTKCSTCNRFLAQSEFCSRCWLFDSQTHSLVRKGSSNHHHYWNKNSQQQQQTPIKKLFQRNL